MTGAAPFFAAESGAPPGAGAVWRRTPDGVRLRIGVLARGTRGTVLCFPGRTEYLEKYGPTARDLEAAGYSMVAIDWRGQGLADRLLPDAALGHVGRFSDYQADVAALTAHAAEAGLPRPWFLLAHSMGGAIGLEALEAGLAVRAAVFTAPMWHVTIPPLARPAARIIPPLAERLGLWRRALPGMSRHAYILQADPADNLLTGDAGTFRWFRSHLRNHPELALAAPTLRWFSEAMRACDRLNRAPLPDLPARVFLGSRERIVSTQSIRAQVARWPGAELVELAEGRHEVLMEAPPLRGQVIAGMIALFDAHCGI
ncbi:alpha/beta fold hydrolase [Mangrovicoccus algicola]|uniref:Alpha/beta hydrolase n=1 Tax=Mangrovicoccus algicola TaxID=2771008 RepID=A0A8J6YX95_9RHOB|nr:alpha/beta hydrolase [Mangrovicoccus algicola]MBE3637506.1 alpha/beta hydrolase [Mangrovicoccus algicola]